MPRNSAPSVMTAMALLASTLSACGGGSSSSTPTTSTGTGTTSAYVSPSTVPEVKALDEYMHSDYLWYKELTAVDLSTVTTADAALELLRIQPKDRYSYIDTTANYNAFFVEGKATGAGFGMVQVGNQVIIRYVRPGSPAANAGLLRGDAVVEVNGTATATLAEIDAVIGPKTAGVALAMGVLRNGVKVSLSMVKASYDNITVEAASDLSSTAGKVAYRYLFTFINRTGSDWAAAVAQLQASGAQNLILDLRDNGGGYVTEAQNITNALVTSSTPSTAIFASLYFNDKNQANNSTYTVNGARPLNLNRVAILSSSATCSASELVINALVALRPSTQFAQIGTATCGKPVGFNAMTYGSKVFSIVTFESKNANAVGGYYNGLTPNCTATDDYKQAWGNAADPLVKAAMNWISTGTCPSANAELQMKTLPTAQPFWHATGGADGQFGLY